MAKDIDKKAKKEKKHFFKDFKAELKKVIWPTPKQVVNNTIAVITIVLITAVIVFTLDLVFKAINTYGINGLKSLVQKESTVNTTDEELTNTESGEQLSTEANDTESTNSNSTEEQAETVEEQNSEEISENNGAKE